MRVFAMVDRPKSPVYLQHSVIEPDHSASVELDYTLEYTHK